MFAAAKIVIKYKLTNIIVFLHTFVIFASLIQANKNKI